MVFAGCDPVGGYTNTCTKEAAFVIDGKTLGEATVCYCASNECNSAVTFRLAGRHSTLVLFLGVLSVVFAAKKLT